MPELSLLSPVTFAADVAMPPRSLLVETATPVLTFEFPITVAPAPAKLLRIATPTEIAALVFRSPITEAPARAIEPFVATAVAMPEFELLLPSTVALDQARAWLVSDTDVALPLKPLDSPVTFVVARAVPVFVPTPMALPLLLFDGPKTCVVAVAVPPLPTAVALPELWLPVPETFVSDVAVPSLTAVAT